MVLAAERASEAVVAPCDDDEGVEIDFLSPSSSRRTMMAVRQDRGQSISGCSSRTCREHADAHSTKSTGP